MYNNNKKIIDLFSGCGGFSLGFHKAGFSTFLAADNDLHSCNTFKSNFQKTAVINDDIISSNFKKKLKKIIASEKIDGVIAGLPCQSFSSVGKAQDKDSMKNDKRNFYYKDFVDCIKIINPNFFIFENVTGILSSKPNGVNIFDDFVKRIQKIGYETIFDKKKLIFNAADYGVPQVRKRIFVIGVKNENIINKIYNELHLSKIFDDKSKYFTIFDAISDLPPLKPGGGQEKIKFKEKKLNKFLKSVRKKNNNYLFNHVARNHNEKDIERYKLLAKIKGELKDLQKIRPELIHHDPKHFKNRYTVQKYDRPGRTVVSHLYKDGNLFIHPDHKQHRTFTVREAARVQSFPDDFQFIGPRTQQYKQVGNAVPPLMSYAIAKIIKKYI